MGNLHYVNQFIKFRLVLTGLATSMLFACGGGDQSADPNVDDFPIAYVKRPVPVNNNNVPVSTDPREVDVFNPGATLYIKPRATVKAQPRDISSRVIGSSGDVRDVEISHNGRRVLFSMRRSMDDTWNIYEYNIGSDSLRRVIGSSIIANQGHDVAPNYLSDGRIVFSSTRQERTRQIVSAEGTRNNIPYVTQASFTDDGDEAAFNLHVMDDRGNNRRQITFNRSHDLDPSLLDDGRIIFVRWDNAAGNGGSFDLYTTNPDGSGTQLYYGNNSHDTGTSADPVQFTQPREMQDGRIVVILRAFTDTFEGGDVVAIDGQNFINYNQPIGNATGTAQRSLSASLTTGVVETGPGISAGGRFSSAFPFWDGTGRILVSYSLCALRLPGVSSTPFLCNDENLADSTAEEVPPAYGLYVWNPSEGSFLTVQAPQPNYYYTDAVVAQDRDIPALINDVTDPTTDDQLGIIHIKSVYDFGVNATGQRELGNGITDNTLSVLEVRDPTVPPLYPDHGGRFIRILRAVPMVDEDTIDEDAFSLAPNTNNPGQGGTPTDAFSMAQIAGYARIEPDGSARFKAPADVPIAISVVDKFGRRISERHQNWITVRNGENLQCMGCHQPGSNNIHGRYDAEPASWNTGWDNAVDTATGFLNTSLVLAPNQGDSMARARLPQDDDAGLLPSLDMVFTDIWSNNALLDISWLFNDLYNNFSDPMELKPVTQECIDTWQDDCRITINYKDHIAPLWRKARNVGGTDVTCINCHSRTDNMGSPRIPAGQLDLYDDTAANPNHFNSFIELFAQDSKLYLDNNGQLTNLKFTNSGGMQVPVYLDNITQTETLNPLDSTNQPNPQVQDVAAMRPSMAAGSARRSYFLDKMSAQINDAPGRDASDGDAGTPEVETRNNVASDPHTTYMQPAELKLITEWLDIGGQNYNNPQKAIAELN